VPELLTPDQITAALAALPGWSGDQQRLTRTIPVPADSQDALEDAVMRVANAMDHHPTIERSGDSMSFALSTHSAGGVTQKDVDLATRIDQVLSGSGSDQGS
jgi:4a-hydroxytetrahydrobiopterin dehydratase